MHGSIRTKLKSVFIFKLKGRWLEYAPHQILHHAHPLTAQLRHQPINIYKVVISDVLNEVVQSNKNSSSPHTRTKKQEKKIPFNLC